MSEPEPTAPAKRQRPRLLDQAKKRLSWSEYWTLKTVRASIDHPLTDQMLRTCQRTVGQGWIHHCTKNLRHVVGMDSIDWQAPGSVLVVANHRSFFDLYVITASLVRRGLDKRILFPVRSAFFYEGLSGLAVNFWMSFFSMYPPLYRERSKAALNALSLDELAWLMDRGSIFAGLHPEGTRNRGQDPYQLLPPRPGVGRLIHRCQVTVVPVFVNGLGNSLVRQVKGNFDGSGEAINVVFGRPIDFGDLRALPGSPANYKAIATRCMDAISALGQQERALRGA